MKTYHFLNNEKMRDKCVLLPCRLCTTGLSFNAPSRVALSKSGAPLRSFLNMRWVQYECNRCWQCKMTQSWLNHAYFMVLVRVSIICDIKVVWIFDFLAPNRIQLTPRRLIRWPSARSARRTLVWTSATGVANIREVRLLGNQNAGRLPNP